MWEWAGLWNMLIILVPMAISGRRERSNWEFSGHSTCSRDVTSQSAMQVEAVQPEVLILRLLQDLEEECQDSAADLVEDCRNPGRPSRETLKTDANENS